MKWKEWNPGLSREELMNAPSGAINYCKMPSQDVLRKYKLTPALYNEMLRRANFSCEICHEAKTLYIDHDHKTGKVRGLLCCRCNAGMGFIDAGFVHEAVAYKDERS